MHNIEASMIQCVHAASKRDWTITIEKYRRIRDCAVLVCFEVSC